MCTAILRVLRIIATIPKAAPVVTVARTTIIAAWGISRSIAMVMAAAIRMSMQQSIMMTAAVAMTMLLTRSITTRMKSMMTMSVAAVALADATNVASHLASGVFYYLV